MPPGAETPVERNSAAIRAMLKTHSAILGSMTNGGHRDDEGRDRAAIEAIVGRSMGGDWPDQALPPGTRVRVIKDAAWDGPWRQVFTGTIDATIVPYPVENPHAQPGELEYSVQFDEPQMDASDLGPYRKAVIWARYLEPL